MKKVILCIVLIIAAVIGIVQILENSPATFMSEPDITQEIVSPNGKNVAFIFESNAGATTAFTYRLSIMKNGKKPKQGDVGNTYISYDEFDVEWIDDNTLKVNNYPTTDIFKQETKVSGVDIQYDYIK